MKKVSLVLLSMIAVVLGFGAPPLSPSTANALGKTILLRGFSYEVAVTDVYVISGKTPVPFELRSYEPGAALRLPVGTATLQFVTPPPASKETPGLQERLKLPLLKWPVIATVELPPVGRDFILGFFPQPATDEKNRFHVLLIENDVTVFPLGNMRIVNLAPFEIGYNLGNVNGTLAPGARVITQPLLDRKYRAYLQLAFPKRDGGWEMFHRGVVSVLPGRRATFFVARSSSYLATFEKESVARDRVKTVPEWIVIPWSDEPSL